MGKYREGQKGLITQWHKSSTPMEVARLNNVPEQSITLIQDNIMYQHCKTKIHCIVGERNNKWAILHESCQTEIPGT